MKAVGCVCWGLSRMRGTVFLKSHIAVEFGSTDGKVSWSTTLVQTEISQQLLDGLP